MTFPTITQTEDRVSNQHGLAHQHRVGLRRSVYLVLKNTHEQIATIHHQRPHIEPQWSSPYVDPKLSGKAFDRLPLQSIGSEKGLQHNVAQSVLL